MSAASCCGFSPRIPSCAPAKLFGDSKAGQRARRRCIRISRAAYPDAAIERFDDDALDGRRSGLRRACRTATARRSRRAILDRGIPFVDLGADFRLDDAATYERWYGHAHEAPELLGAFVYGIPELNREAIRGAKAVAAAGCYATAAILALKPLVDAGLVNPDSLIVDAASGVSGAGREAQGSDRLQHGRRKLRRLRPAQPPPHGRNGNGAGRDGAVHAAPRADDPRHPRDLLRRGDGRRAIRWRRCRRPMPTSRSSTSPTQPPATKWVTGLERRPAHRPLRRADRPRARASSAIDNLGKGAAGQMIQCANLMLGLDETAGLTTIGVYP